MAVIVPSVVTVERCMSDSDPDSENRLNALVATARNQNQYVILNRESKTVSEVDLIELSCTCEDHEYRKSGSREVCKHVEKALITAPVRPENTDPGVQVIGSAFQSGPRPAADGAGVIDVDAVDQESSADVPTDRRDDPVAKVRQAMRTRYGVSEEALEQIEVWEHDEFGSIQIELDGYVEDDALGKAIFNNDVVIYDDDGPGADNYIPSDDVDEYVRGP